MARPKLPGKEDKTLFGTLGETGNVILSFLIGDKGVPAVNLCEALTGELFVA